MQSRVFFASLRQALATSCFLLAVSQDARSQDVEFGVTSGANYSRVERSVFAGTDTAQVDVGVHPDVLGEAKVGSVLGVFGRWDVSQSLSLQSGVTLARRGMYNPFEDVNANLDYVSLPLRLQLKIAGPIRFSVGAEPRFLLASENWGELIPAQEDLGISSGFFWQTPITGMGLSANYSIGAVNVVAFGFPAQGISEQGYQNSALSLALHYDPFARRRSYRNKPPVLRISGVDFVDENGNRALDANERTSIQFDLSNDGFGLAKDLIVEVYAKGDKQGVEFQRKVRVNGISPGKSTHVSIPISADRTLVTGELNLEVFVIEPNGFNPNNSPIRIQIPTTEFAAPMVEVVDFDAQEVWETNQQISVGVLVQNTGLGTAERVKLTMKADRGVWQDPIELSEVKSLMPGEAQALAFDFYVPKAYRKPKIQLSLDIEESYGEYSRSWAKSFPVRNSSSSEEVIKITRADSLGGVSIAALRPEILFNEFAREDTIRRIFVCPNTGSDCFGDATDAQDVASDAEILLLGVYDILERRHFETVLNEQRLAASGLVFEESAVELGCNEGSQGILFVEEGCADGKSAIRLKMVGCKTSEIYWTCVGRGASAMEVISRVKLELLPD